MSVVLAIEPDSSQAEALRKAVRGRADVELVLVSNTAAAIRALERSVPDLILVSALLSPRDEDALFAHLRSLDGSSHLQTLTIPQLRLGKAPAAKRGSLGRFRKKPAAPEPAGCDPALFVAEVVAHLARAKELQSQAAEMAPTRTTDRRPAVEPPLSIERPVEVAPRIQFEQPILQAERSEEPPRLEADRGAAWGVGAPQAERSERAEGSPRLTDDPWVDLDVDALTQQLGLNSARLELQDQTADARREEELARVEAEAQVRLTAEIERVQHEAEERHQHELARVQAEAKAQRQTAVEHARVEAEYEARRTLAAEQDQAAEARREEELARVEAEAQVRLTAEIERVQREADKRHRHELARVQAEAEAQRQTAVEQALVEAEAEERRQHELARVQAEAETQRQTAVEHARVEAEYEARRTLAAELEQAAEARREEELARVGAEAQARLTAEIERVQREAEERHRHELARVQAEAEAQRQTAVEHARAEAEYEARHALAAELEQVRLSEIARHAHATELEQIRLNEIARVQAEADKRCDTAARQAREAAEAEAARTMMQELGRVRAEVEQALNDQLDRARAEADALRKAELARAQAEATVLRAAAAEDARLAAEAAASRALEGEVARVRADAEVRLRAELDVIRAENEHLRRADQSEAKQTSEKVREAAIRDARAIAEAANHTLEDQLVKVRAEAAARLEAELCKARSDAEQQRTTELEEIRAQVSHMRESAALQARKAAAEAIASEVARAGTEPEPIAIHAEPTVVDSRPATAAATSYYNLWNPPAEPKAAPPPEPEPPRRSVQFVRSKWALPVAATLLLIAGNAIVIGWSWRPHFPKAAPVPIVAPVEQSAAHIADEVTVKTGRIDVTTDPPGAQVLLDGARTGKTPLMLSKLKPGRHTLVLQGSAGTITRTVVVKAGETAQVSEGIFSGWLAVFAGIPVNIYVGGQLRGTTEDGQLMLSAGAHAVELVNERLNYRETKNFTIEPGQVVTYSIALPTSVIRINSPDGTEVSIDGATAGRTPLGDLQVPIGTHEIVGTSPEMGQRRESIEVKRGEPAEVTFK